MQTPARLGAAALSEGGTEDEMTTQMDSQAVEITLTIVTGEQVGRAVTVGTEPITVGRGTDSKLMLLDANVSRRHATLRALDDGTLEVRDVGSANGTFVNDERIEQAIVRPGDRLRMGDTVLHAGDEDDQGTRIGAPAASAAAAPARPTESQVRRALRSSSFIKSLRADSAIHRLVIAPEVKRTRYLTLAALGVALVAILGLAGLVLFGGGSKIEDAVAKVEPSTVLVVPQRDGQPNGNGSGWVWDAKRGLIVTNAHVVGDGESFQVSIGDELVPARVVGVAPCEDLAVLKVRTTAALKSIQLGSQGAIKRGETVVAVGFPQSASADANLTSTAGVVSVVRTRYSEEALDIPSYRNVVQTDAAINPGNSGGPLVDLNGRLVGVNSAGRTTNQSGRIVQGQSYAIGVDRVKQVVPQLASGRSLAWIGAGFRYPSVDQLSKQGLPEGIYIDGAVAGSPADKAGLAAEAGLLTAVDGRPVANTLASWCAAVGGAKSGQEVTLDVIPPGARKPVPVKVRLG
jgi:S1-C subfamily serine protease